MKNFNAPDPEIIMVGIVLLWIAAGCIWVALT